MDVCAHDGQVFKDVSELSIYTFLLFFQLTYIPVSIIFQYRPVSLSSTIHCNEDLDALLL